MRTLDRFVAIMEAAAVAGSGIVPARAARDTGLSISTVSRLMREMAIVGLLEPAERAGSYTLGWRLLGLARGAIERGGITETSLPHMRRLRDASQETVSLHVRHGDLRVCVARVQSTQPIHRVVPVGFSAPLHFGATGEVLLCGLSEADLSAYLRRAELDVDIAALRCRLAKIRSDGYGMAVGAWVSGLSGVAASIRSGSETVASLSVSGPADRWTRSAMRRFAPELKSATDEISRALPADPPHKTLSSEPALRTRLGDAQ